MRHLLQSLIMSLQFSSLLHSASWVMTAKTRIGIEIRKSIAIIAGAVCTVCYIGSANAFTIDFESLPTGACASSPTDTVSTQGFTFLAGYKYILLCDGTRSDLASNGTNTVGDEYSWIGMTKDDGGSFSIASIDLAELFTETPAGNQVTIEGIFIDGGSVSVTFTLDGINDGAGGVADFETFLLPSSFIDLVRVVLIGTHNAAGDSRFLLDNIEIVTIQAIDIKPGNKQNVINPRAKGGIWVAVLSDTEPESPFDPSSQVDIPTVEFGPDSAKANRYKVKDINKDGLGDLLLRFKIPATGIACGDTEATLTGETFDGQSFTGTDSIKTVGCKP